MPILKDQAKEIARLSRLELSAEELDRMAADMSAILRYIDMLAEVDTTSLNRHPGQILHENRLRPDIPGKSLTQAESLANAPRTDGTFFQVPRVIDR